jgi:hypothetical protein
MALCPDCDGHGRVLMPFAALLVGDGRQPAITETVALRACVICGGEGWYLPGPGR